MNHQFAQSVIPQTARRKKFGADFIWFSLARPALVIVALSSFTAQVYAQGGIPLWTNTYNGVGNGTDTAWAIAADGNGNVFVAGWSVSGGGSHDYAMIKYSGAGAPLWTNRYGRPGVGQDQVPAVAVDGSGNVFLTGSSPASDYVTIKYSGEGVPLWTNFYNGPGNHFDEASAVAVDGSGNVVVTGSSAGIDGGKQLDYATIKYSSAGATLWINRYNGPASDPHYALDSASAIAVDGSGNVVVTGSSNSGGVTHHDYATIKYSGAGVPLWTNRYSGPANHHDFPNAIAVDSSGNVVVTGEAYFDDTVHYATIKYSATGLPLWTNRYDVPGNPGHFATDVAVDSSGNVFVTGYSAGHRPTFPYNFDYATIKYSGAGVPLWTNRYDGPANSDDAAYALAVDSSGNAFVTGSSASAPTFPYNDNFATIKYSALSPAPLNYLIVSNQLVLSWSNAGFGLQSAPGIPGTFTNISGATSPYTNSVVGSQQYFRLRGN